MFSNWNKMFDNINKLSNPLGNNLDWITKLNSINTSGLAAIEFTKAFHNNSLHQNLMYNDIAKSLDFISDNSIKSVIDNIYNNNGIDVYKDILNKIHSTNYWGNLTKLVILDELNSASNEDELENVMSNISDNIDTINLSLEDIDKDPIAFFNNICLSIKSYMDNNPSVKYSSYFIFWLISTIIIPILLSKAESSEEKKSGEIQISNNYNITNNYYSNSIIAKINTKSVSLKNYPRDKSKTVHLFKKNDKVRVLKDSLKWALVIKENSIEAGWIRKEFLNFTEN